jgi:hypothetical protein
VTFEVPTVVLLKIQAFWNVLLCEWFLVVFRVLKNVRKP